MERWDEGLEKRLGEKRCSVCEKKLEVGEDFLLKKREYFHPDCYLEDKAEKIRENGEPEFSDEVEKEIVDRDLLQGGESN